MMDHIQDDCVPIRISEIASSEKIKEATMKKIQVEPRKWPLKVYRVQILAAVVVLALSITAGAAISRRAGGFTLTGGMSDAEIKALIEDASLAVGAEYEDKDGSVHYLDRDGNEVLVLSAEDAAAYERARQERWEKKIKESTSLVDLFTMPLLPNEATELAVGADGRFADFALSNGGLILLHPEGESAYTLKAGDIVTITLSANDKCALEFGCFKDGAFLDGEAVSAQQHGYSFHIQADGQYCFYVEYYSAGMSAFQNCVIVVQ